MSEYTICRWDSTFDRAIFPEIDGERIYYTLARAREVCKQYNELQELIMGGPDPLIKYWSVSDVLHIRGSGNNSLCQSGNAHKRFVGRLHNNSTCNRCLNIDILIK
jgi:hypothetical protein